MFALFDSSGQGDAALREMDERGFTRQSCHTIAHRDRISEGDLNLAESDAIRGLVFGLVAASLAARSSARCLAPT